VSTEFDVPAELDDLCAQPHFLQHIRQYNMAMAMASVGHECRALPGGPGTVILSGRAYHRVSGGMFPGANWTANFAQIYLLDPDDATNVRMEVQHSVLRPDVLRVLHNIMMNCNPWVRQFCQAHPLPIQCVGGGTVRTIMTPCTSAL